MANQQDSRRAHRRTNLFVIAMASSATFSGSVRVRNLSAQGALIEANTLPGLHERVKLRKGTLSASGNIVWVDGNKAGLAFQRPIIVGDWLPSRGRAQDQVDSHFNKLQSELNENQSPAKISELAPGQPSRTELEGIADMLDALADDLSDDPLLVEKYLEKLQVLDVAAQKLRALVSQ